MTTHTPKQCLTFVYNAESSFFAQVLDLVHKTASPKTYQCHLCSLTYSGVSMKKEWKEFIGKFPCPAHFLHKDEFEMRYPKYAVEGYPVIFEIEAGVLKKLISADEVNELKTLADLESLIMKRLQ